MKLTKRIRPNKKSIIILAIIILLAASQWWLVRMVYAKNIQGEAAFWLARVYHLQAGVIKGDNKTTAISLADYFRNYDFAKKYLANLIKMESQYQDASGQATEMPGDDEIKKAVWQKMIQEKWLTSIAIPNKLTVSKQDVVDGLKEVDDLEAMKKSVRDDLDISFEEYQALQIEPAILEAKVYKYLLENYNDRAGMEKAQAAYQALTQDKKDFVQVAKEYSDDMTYVEQSWFATEDTLGEFSSAVSDLEPGEYSKIIVSPGDPGAYVILKLVGNTVDPESGQEAKELRGIAIKAKSMEDFFNEYLQTVEVKEWY